MERAWAYRSGDPAAGLDATELRRLVEALAASWPGQALALLDTASDVVLGTMFADGELARDLGLGFAADEDDEEEEAGEFRADLEQFYRRRFGVGPEEVAAGGVRPLVVYPVEEFRPALVDPRLDGLTAGAGLTSDQARAALSGRSDAELEQALEGLPPAQVARAWWWVARARNAAGWADRAVAYLAGDPAVVLDAGQQRDLVRDLVTGRASGDERWLALQLLRVASSEDLGVMADPAGGLLGLLEEAIPAAHELRPSLDQLLAERFEDGQDGPAEGRVVRYRQSAGTFTPALVDPFLTGLRLDREPAGDELSRVEAAIGRHNLGTLVGALSRLPWVERARAARWLAGVRVALHAQGSSPVMGSLDHLLDLLYRAAARDVPDPMRLRLVTIRPPAEQAAELRGALDPAPQEAGGPPEPFTGQLPGQGQDFAVRLAEAYRSDIEAYTQSLVAGRRTGDRGPGRLFTMEQMGGLAAVAGGWIAASFGHLVAVPELLPDGDGFRGNIHDQWLDAAERIAGMSADERHALARSELLRYPTKISRAAVVLREHHAVPVFDQQGVPGNEEARIISAVIEDLLRDSDEDIVGRVLDIYRGLPGETFPATREIWVQVFREAVPGQNQAKLWDYAQIFIHETLHLLEHPDYQRYHSLLGFGTHAYDALAEGVVSLLTEIVWSGVPFRHPAVRAQVEGEYASGPPLRPDQVPHPASRRYASMAEVMRLVHLVGDVRNLYAAFFLGDVEKITGPVSVAVMGSPQAPLPAGEVAALVARLNALPPAELSQYRFSVFTDAPQAATAEWLAQSGARFLTVVTTPSGDAGAADRAAGPAPQEPGVPGEGRVAEPGVSGEEPVRPASISAALASGRDLLSARMRARAHLSGDPAAALDADEMRRVVRDLMAGSGPQAILANVLLWWADDAVLGAMFAGGTLARELDGSIPPGDEEERRPELEDFYQWRFGVGQDEVAAGRARPLAVYPAAEFSPGLIDAGLAGLPVAVPLTRAQARSALFGRRDSELVQRLAGLPPVEAARKDWWVARARRAAGWEGRAADFLASDPEIIDASERRELVIALTTGLSSVNERWEALQLLRSASDADLDVVFDREGEMPAVLEEAFPYGHPVRPALRDFWRRRRLSWGRDQRAAGPAAPRGEPASGFTPALLGRSLDGLDPDEELSAAVLDRVAGAVFWLNSWDLARRLMELPVTERARAVSWLTGVRVALRAQGEVFAEALATVDDTLDVLYQAAARHAPDADALRTVTIRPPAVDVTGPEPGPPGLQLAGWADQALSYLAGDPAVTLDAAGQRDLAADLASRPDSDDKWLALQLLWAASDEDLEVMFDPAGGLLAVLEENIPAGHEVRPSLDHLLAGRFRGGRGEVAAGRVAPFGQPAGTFTPALLDPSLAGLPLDREPAGGELSSFEDAIGRRDLGTLAGGLSVLPAVERARAARWLAGVRVALHAQGSSRQVMRRLDQLLDMLYQAAARNVPNYGALRLLTIRPPAGSAGELRRALDPAPREPGGPPEPFARQLPGPGQDFAARLAEAYRSDIERYTQLLVAGRRAGDRGADRLFTMEEMGELAAAAREWIAGVFGHLVTVPELVADREGIRGNIHDQWLDAGERIAGMSPDERHTEAHAELLRYPTVNTRVAQVVREHHAVLVFDQRGVPGNEEAQIISAVIEDLLSGNDEDENEDDQDIVGRVLEIQRGRPGRMSPETREIWVQVFREPEPRQDQAKLWDYAQILIHETLHLLEHPDYQRYRELLGFGTHACDALAEGVVSLLTEIVWSGVPFLDPVVRARVEGRYASEPPLRPDQVPHPASRRYASMAEVMRLVHLVGDVRNLYAAFFLGDLEKITGPVSVVVMGSPQAPLPAGEVAALVARLNALPPAELSQYRVSVFTDAPQAATAEWLAQSGARFLTVVTTPGGDAGAADGAAGPAPQQPGTDAPSGAVASRPRGGPGEGAEGVLAARLGGGELEALRSRMIAFLGQDESPAIEESGQGVLDGLVAVLAEATGVARDGAGQDEVWDSLVSSGLAHLFPVAGGLSYTGSLPGVDPAGLVAGAGLTVPGLIRAHARVASVTGQVRFEIVSARGRDVSGLVGSGSDLVMFGRGERFEVAAVVAGDPGQWLVRLTDPGDGPGDGLTGPAGTPPGDEGSVGRPQTRGAEHAPADESAPADETASEVGAPPVGGVAGPAEQAVAYLSGAPDGALDAGQLRRVVVALTGPQAGLRERALALLVLQSAGDAELGVMFAGGGLAQALDAGFPANDGAGGRLREGLERFYERRFGPGQQAALAAGTARPREVYPAGKFGLGLIETDLADRPVDAPVTAAEAEKALFGRPDAELEQDLAGLPPAEMARAAWWVTQARETAGWADQVRAYLTGNPAVRLAADEQADLVVALVTGLASRDERRLALQLLRAANDDDLSVIVDGEELPKVLDKGIPDGHQLRPELDAFLEQRFVAGRSTLAVGGSTAQGLPAGAFTPALLHTSLADLDPDAVPAGAVLDRAADAVISQSTEEGSEDPYEVLPLLPAVERARAARWLTAVRVELQARDAQDARDASPRGAALAMVDDTLDALYRAAAEDVPDPDSLRLLTIRPPAEQADELRRVLDPLPSGAGGQAQGFTSRLPRQEEDFRGRLRKAYEDTLQEHAQELVDAEQAADPTPGRSYSMEDMWKIMLAAKEWTDKVFGHLVTGVELHPDQPGIRGNFHDQRERAAEEIEAQSPGERHDLARERLMDFLTMKTQVSEVVREHDAVPLFNEQGVAQNPEAQIIREVIDELLPDDDDDAVARVLDSYRGWPMLADPSTGAISVQVFRTREDLAWNQRELWKIAAGLVHEYLHLLTHPRFGAYCDSLGSGTHAFNALAEGVVCLLTEIVWSHVQFQDPDVRARVEGDYAAGPPLEQVPHPDQYRYESMAEVMRLVNVVGDVRNLYAAFFLGDVEKITGPVSTAVIGSPREPLPAEEVAALAARLATLPVAERLQLQVGLFGGASPRVIERPLTEAGPASCRRPRAGPSRPFRW